ncbi:enoyl-CoA hydratase-related protein [Taibaiella soli]|uniref:2-(1,2-epoxy-1,2-dihydrophenyl)acetyl-CoA isomerase n=1 Tax=Taibaiella soli TaxID=1649169 RepID=A0A2W2B9K7_9BACT|nr:enoyl-CoA hydratase-related protein [Taibaiella soli]PZF72959.1 2-(1,2-epoxy-1,2-dihydrophenyl)acetyl-CoA isomerase [Taibaiella soli]
MSTVLLHIENGVAYITLNRPEKYNSFNRDMALTLQAHLDACEKDDNVRCIYITGNGKGFCAGQDLSEFPSPAEIDFEKVVREHYNPVISRFRNIEKPIVAAVNGVAAGAGANLALACDVVVANKSASFVQAFSKIGLVPDSGGTFFLPRLVGLQRASALMMLADKVTAEEAVNMGMIYRAYDDEMFEQESKRIAATLAQMPTIGLGLTKRALNQSYNNNLNQQLELEKELQVKAGRTEDFKEGVNGFLEKRKPEFKGK